MDAAHEQGDVSPSAAQRPRWLLNSWTIATLLLALVVAAMVFGTQVVTKRNFIDRLTAQQATVVYEPLGPQWLVDAGGEGYGRHFNRIVEIRAPKATLSRADIAYIAGLRHLRKLDLSETAIGDDELDVLAQLPALVWLNVRRTRVTELGIENLRQQRPTLRVEH